MRHGSDYNNNNTMFSNYIWGGLQHNVIINITTIKFTFSHRANLSSFTLLHKLTITVVAVVLEEHEVLCVKLYMESESEIVIKFNFLHYYDNMLYMLITTHNYATLFSKIVKLKTAQYGDIGVMQSVMVIIKIR